MPNWSETSTILRIHSSAPGAGVLRLEQVAGANQPVTVNFNSVEGDHPEHSHDFLEVALMTGGSGMHHALGEGQKLAAGDILVLRPGISHRYSDCEALEVVNCCVNWGLLGRDAPWTRRDPAVSSLLLSGPLSGGRRGLLSGRLRGDNLARAVEYLTHLQDALSRRRPTSASEVSAWFVLLVCHLAVGGEWPPMPAASQPPAAVTQAAELMEADLTREWRLGDLARHVNCDPSHLTRMFSRHLGISAMSYLAQMRFERAAALLAETDLAVGLVGARVGWPDPNYFARAFRAHCGMSPRAYRGVAETTGGQLHALTPSATSGTHSTWPTWPLGPGR